MKKQPLISTLRKQSFIVAKAACSKSELIHDVEHSVPTPLSCQSFVCKFYSTYIVIVHIVQGVLPHVSLSLLCKLDKIIEVQLLYSINVPDIRSC